MIKKWKFIGLFIPFVLFLAACGSVVGPGGLIVGSSTTHEVGSIADSRFGTGLTLDGTEMATTRSKLLKSSNFGQSGTVAFAFNITDTAAAQGTITITLLSAFDLFFVGALDDSDADFFTNAELAAFLNWVNTGGVMILACDSSTYGAVCNYFGYPSAISSTSPTTPTVIGSSHPVFGGSFGTVSLVNMGGTIGFFPLTAGATILGEDSAGSPNATVIERQIGLGTVIFISDIDMITDQFSGITAGTGIVNDNDRFLGNLFEYAIDIL